MIMKNFLIASWKTTFAGLVIAAGQVLVLAPLAHFRALGPWVNGDSRHDYMVAGVILAALGSVLLGIVSRDHNVSTEKACGKKL